jgi:hypothetical protein
MAALTIFDRLNRGRSVPTPTEAAREDPTTILLEWIIKYWPRPTIAARDINRCAPRALRDKETALRLAQNLVERGWLIPLKTHRYDRHQWQIARGLPLTRPGTVAASPNIQKLPRRIIFKEANIPEPPS